MFALIREIQVLKRKASVVCKGRNLAGGQIDVRQNAKLCLSKPYTDPT